ncbi:hypothetical protein TrRE_jg6681 [Triparma retinervis]|uniref:Uncharacterized protein n=1 Tax=Triparma retinervis TaxID=2557542 RepID=A0A9W7AT34_9STRA|nr:hypothetical protein TrRE_jg6681 [Triparma retinervis]
MRALFVLVIVIVEGLEIWITKEDEPPVVYRKNSKLTSAQHDMTGIRQLTWFTHWSWCLIGVYFASALILPNGHPISVVVWEIAMPNAFLVTIICTFVIWKGLLEKEASTDGMKRPRTLVMHNANIAMCACEMFFASTDIHISHLGLAPLFGCLYVFFSWWRAPRISPESGPQYLYDFFDTTLPLQEVMINYCGVLFVLVAFYALVCVVSWVLDMTFWHDKKGLEGLLLACFVYSIMRFED